MKRRLLPIVPALALIALTACASGPQTQPRMKANPSSDFLTALAHEVSDGRAGPYCEQVIDDWIAQNALR